MKKLDVNWGTLGRNLRLSPFEWVALVATVVFAGVVTFNYLNSTQPLRSKLNDLQARKKNAQSKLTDDTKQQIALNEQRENAGKILDSLESFESRLHSRKVGITAIIDEVNRLAKANRVVAGDIGFRSEVPEQLPGEVAAGTSPGTSPTPASFTRRDRLPNVYEGLGIDTSVEGDYHDLRRFISALERSRNFVIINAITLQSVDEKQRTKFKIGAPMGGAEVAMTNPTMNPPGAMPQGVPNPGAMPGAAPGADAAASKVIVSLKIELETHFARETKLEAAPRPQPANAPAPRQ
ncbi:MAG TPA: hypothetical protein VFZ34_16260 [Blastocatellia bacterium]|nr:hypothetical protein [Blastocatellia bacterium]